MKNMEAIHYKTKDYVCVFISCEYDIKKHIKKYHGISVSYYHNDFNGKLKKPKLQRPEGIISNEMTRSRV